MKTLLLLLLLAGGCSMYEHTLTIKNCGSEYKNIIAYEAEEWNRQTDAPLFQFGDNGDWSFYCVNSEEEWPQEHESFSHNGYFDGKDAFIKTYSLGKDKLLFGKVVLHEFGHGLALKHTENTESVMCAPRTECRSEECVCIRYILNEDGRPTVTDYDIQTFYEVWEKY